MIKIGVVGTGSMGKNHARVCSELDNVDLVGIADFDKETAKIVADRVGTTAYYDYKELMPITDAVIIATPTITHYDIAKNFLNNGKHVLVEKPLCENVDKAERLLKKTEDNLVFAVGHIERHNPAVGFIKEAMDNKRFGKLITIASKRVSKLPGRIKDVGVIFDFGVHDIDVMRYLGGEVESVYARAGRFNENIDYEDHANVTLNFENSICGIVEVNWLTPTKIRKLFLTCSETFVEADYINQTVTLSSSSFKNIDEMDLFQVPIEYNTNQVVLEKREPLKNEIQDFVNSIENDKKPLVSCEDGLMALKIVEAATQSYKNREEVKIL
jgi:UDP-N-acetylglucosamine 3-dehydrogenase